MTKEVPFLVDVDHILQTKASNKKLPRFVVNYLKKIIHQKEVNGFLSTKSHLKNENFVEAALEFLNITITVEGRENFPPKEGRYIFAGNHPLGGMDGMVNGMIVAKEYGRPVRFISNDMLLYLKPMQDMFVPVNKFGPSMSRENARIMAEMYESDDNLVTFPAGICSRKTKGVICDLEWKKNFITKAIEYKRDVVPMYFEGKNSRFFYNLANLRKFLGIKFNIEMMYLADEMFKQRGNHFTIKVGKAIPWQTFDKSKTHQEWAQWVKDKTYELNK